MISVHRTGYFTFFVLFFSLNVYGRHLDTERDISACPEGFWPLSIENNDGFLKLTCFKPRCEEIQKQQPVCSAALTDGCPKGCFVGSIHRQFKGNHEKAEYKTKCCSHPILLKPVSIKPQPDFVPGAKAKDAASGQGDYIEVVTNILVNPRFDHHGIEITSVLCQGSSTTRRSTIRPSTRKPDSREHNNNNPGSNNGGGGGGGGGSNGNNGNNGGHGGNSGGHEGHGGSHECGATGCNQNPKLEGGTETKYAKQNVPKPGKPPASASDPKAWGFSPKGGGSGCFSADTLVRTRMGEKRMDEVEVGDEILSSVSWDGNSAVSYQRITQFIHKDPSVFSRYTVIHTDSGRSLSLTPYHLLPHFDCHILERPTVSVREYESLFIQSAKFAHKARAGQCVLVVDTSGKFVAERISNVTTAVRQGVFSPITASGIIVANGVQASCYSSVENHAMQHAFFTFVHKVTQAWKPYVERAKRLFSTTPMADDGQIPTLLKVMLVLSDLVMGSF